MRPTVTPRKGPWQFTLKQLLVVTTLWAGGCAVAAQFGVGVLVGVLVLSLAVAGIVCSRRHPVVATIVGGLLCLGVLLALLLPALTTSRESDPPCSCPNNLKQIGTALCVYHEEYGCFPPAYVTDDAGRPMHSWRVLILPYVGEQDLYDAYHFDEPWNGPNNSKLGKIPVQTFQCPSDGQNGRTTTNYVAVVGPDTPWPGRASTNLDEDFADGPENTLLVVEVTNSGISWIEPRDLHVTQMPPRINSKAGQGISSGHPGGANVSFADGSIRFLPDGLSPKTLRAMLTRTGAEKIDSVEY